MRIGQAQFITVLHHSKIFVYSRKNISVWLDFIYIFLVEVIPPYLLDLYVLYVVFIVPYIPFL